jgi:hypothetical protein
MCVCSTDNCLYGNVLNYSCFDFFYTMSYVTLALKKKNLILMRM